MLFDLWYDVPLRPTRDIDLLGFGVANSRMKDYFDLWVLLRNGDLEPRILELAVQATLARRGTVLLIGIYDLNKIIVWPCVGNSLQHRHRSRRVRSLQP